RLPLQAPDLWGTVAAMAAPPRTETAIPAWIESDLLVVNGRDPLGLDAIATYRIMPELLPGILQLSRRARYFSFFAYLLSVYRSPLQALNVVAAEDTPLDDTHRAPHDVLANSRARELAAHFAAAVGGTEWAGRYLGGDDPVPARTLKELADAACLCRLDDAKE